MDPRPAPRLHARRIDDHAISIRREANEDRLGVAPPAADAGPHGTGGRYVARRAHVVETSASQLIARCRSFARSLMSMPVSVAT